MTNEEQVPPTTDATMEIMFDEARQGQAFLSQWADAIDAKVLGVFGAASVLIGAIPAIGGVKAHGWEWTPWVVAGIAWAIASILCWMAYGTRSYLLGPDPSTILNESWTSLAPNSYRFYRIRDMGKAWSNNQEVINEKAEALGWALPFVAIETGALLVALMLQQ